MTTQKLLDNAIDYIYKLVGEDEDWICEELLAIPMEKEICEKTCSDFCKDCIRRYLKHHKKEER